jgi:hypothetical protein
MHIQVPHQMNKDAAVARIKNLIVEYRKEIEANAQVKEEKWEDDTLHFAVALQGKDVTGSLAVDDTNYILDAKLPLLWRMFEGRIEAEIEKQLGVQKPR